MFHTIWLRVLNNVFLKSVSVLAFGVLLSQVILLASTPILTRLFPPASFGILAVFTSVSTMAAILTTGRYELAIAMPDDDSEAVNVTGLIIFLGSAVSLLYLVLILALRYSGIQLGGDKNFVHTPVIFLIPIFTFLAANFTAFQYWSMRFKNYKQISIANIIQVFAATFVNIILGLENFTGYGLVIGLLVGQFMATVYLFYLAVQSKMLVNISLSSIKKVSKKYISFPKYMVLSDFASTTSQQVIPVIFSFLYSTTIVGFFALANRMLKIPAIVLTNSITTVFRNDALDMIREQGNCRRLFRSTFKKLIWISAPIFSLLAIFAPFLFTWVFGDQWTEAGHFARVICLMLILDFVILPFNSLFYILSKQRLYMNLQLVKTVSNVCFIFIGYVLTKSAYATVLFFAVSDSIFSVVTLLLSYKYSGMSEDQIKLQTK